MSGECGVCGQPGCVEDNHPTLCPHGDITAACIDCLTGTPPERPNPPAVRPEVVTRPFSARYAGHCPACNLAIHEGQTIVRMSDDTHRHHNCGDPR